MSKKTSRKTVDCFGPSVPFDSIYSYSFEDPNERDHVSVKGSTGLFSRNEITGFLLLFEPEQDYGDVKLEEFVIDDKVLDPIEIKFTASAGAYRLCTAVKTNIPLKLPKEQESHNSDSKNQAGYSCQRPS